MRVNLTDVLLRATEPPAVGTLTLWDTNLKHFGVRLSSGGAKTIILLLGSGTRHARGRFEPKVFGLGQARDKARKILAENVHLEGDGHAIFNSACKLGHEGIVARRKDLAYESGRSRRWLKIKNPNSAAAKRVEDGSF